MPTVRKLTSDEVSELKPHRITQRQRIASEYDTFLEGFSAGEYGEVQLDTKEKRATIRNRIVAAAERRGLRANFSARRRNRTLIFCIEDHRVANVHVPSAAIQPESTPSEAQQPNSASPEPVAETQKRRGRPPRAKA